MADRGKLVSKPAYGLDATDFDDDDPIPSSKAPAKPAALAPPALSRGIADLSLSGQARPNSGGGSASGANQPGNLVRAPQQQEFGLGAETSQPRAPVQSFGLDAERPASGPVQLQALPQQHLAPNVWPNRASGGPSDPAMYQQPQYAPYQGQPGANQYAPPQQQPPYTGVPPPPGGQPYLPPPGQQPYPAGQPQGQQPPYQAYQPPPQPPQVYGRAPPPAGQPPYTGAPPLPGAQQYQGQQQAPPPAGQQQPYLGQQPPPGQQQPYPGQQPPPGQQPYPGGPAPAPQQQQYQQQGLRPPSPTQGSQPYPGPPPPPGQQQPYPGQQQPPPSSQGAPKPYTGGPPPPPGQQPYPGGPPPPPGQQPYPAGPPPPTGQQPYPGGPPPPPGQQPYPGGPPPPTGQQPYTGGPPPPPGQQPYPGGPPPPPGQQPYPAGPPPPTGQQPYTGGPPPPTGQQPYPGGPPPPGAPATQPHYAPGAARPQPAPRPPPPRPPLYTLDLLPPDQPLVHLTDIQANDIIQQLVDQSHHAGSVPPRMVDLADAHHKLIHCLDAQPLAYMRTVEMAAPNTRLPINAKPSLLQTKLKTGKNRLQDLVHPVIEPGQQGFVDLAYTPDGALIEETARVWQCRLSLVRAEGVGPTGLRDVRSPCLYVARMALFDRARNRFLGNVLGVRPSAVVNKDKTWEFNAKESLVLRCSCVQPDPRSGTRLVNEDALSLYIEFNTSYRLDIADTKEMPPHEKRAAKMVDEVTSAWSMLNFRRCCQASSTQEASVPLYYGSLFNPQSLDALYKAKRKQNPLGSLLKPKVTPVLVFKAGPLTNTPPPILPFGYLPSTLVATNELGMALGAYRVVLALQLARQTSKFAVLADPVLASFPDILADSHLLTEFLVKWKDGVTKLEVGGQPGCLAAQLLPPVAMVVELFRRCVAEVSPLVHCNSLPPRHINNFVEYQGHRLKLVQQFCHIIDARTNTVTGSRHPVEPLSHAGFEFLHKPFDVAETRVSMADKVERGTTFLNI